MSIKVRLRPKHNGSMFSVQVIDNKTGEVFAETEAMIHQEALQVRDAIREGREELSLTPLEN